MKQSTHLLELDSTTHQCQIVNTSARNIPWNKKSHCKFRWEYKQWHPFMIGPWRQHQYWSSSTHLHRYRDLGQEAQNKQVVRCQIRSYWVGGSVTDFDKNWSISAMYLLGPREGVFGNEYWTFLLCSSRSAFWDNAAKHARHRVIRHAHEKLARVQCTRT